MTKQEPPKKTIETEFKRYVLNKSCILNLLEPEKVLKTGFKEIDENCPIILGENSIITGRTGMGKTVLGANIVNGILQNSDNTKVLVLSLELKHKAFIQRLLSCESNIEGWKIRKGFKDNNNTTFTSEKENFINVAKKYIDKFKDRILIVDDINSIEFIEKLLADLQKNFHFKPDYILIDYANILTTKNLTDLNKHVQISTWIKFLAKKNNIHVQAICQANRATKENTDAYARTENLADSDQYGRDAFTVYSIKTSKEDDKYFINPTKNRNGKPEEEIEYKWNPKSGKIINPCKY